jgi:Carboxypeptidase regulatory-like domain/TonB dependent receptor-like, beta-barrel/TonB-dependent Receptor Plug Domain
LIDRFIREEFLSMRGLVCVLGVVTVLAAGSLAAQTSGGTVSGVAQDEQGAVVPGVSVSATSDSAPGIHRAVTDRNGRYAIADLPPAEYTITAELSGFATFKRPSVVVRAGKAMTVDLVMKVGAIGETVEVRLETPLLDTHTGSQSVNVSGDLLRSVPLTERREWYGALALAPGVVTSDFSGSKLFYVRGSEPSATLVRVDGADVTGAAKPGVSYLQLNMDTVEDIQIQTGGVSASAPLGSGGVITIATASGTNRVKGAGTMFVQPRRWNDSNQPGGTSTSVDQMQIDLSAGGPIVKDRLWAFGSYRHLDTTTGVSRTAAQLAVLDALVSGFEPLDNRNEAGFWFVKLTARPGRHQLAGFYQQDTNPVVSATATSQYPSGQATGGTAASLRLSSVWSSRVTTRASASYNDKRRETRDGGVDGPNVRIYDSTIASGGRLVGNGMLASLGNPLLSRLTQPNEKLALAFDVTLFASQGSTSHELQAGAYAERRVQGNHLVYTNGGFNLEERVLREPAVYTGPSVPFHRTVVNGPELTTFNQTARDLAAYVEDAWRLSPRLTITGGVRVDRIHVEDTVFGITAQRSVEIGPRAGANYALTADSRTVARGYWARVHDQPGLVTSTGTPNLGQRDLYDLDLDGTFETVFLTPATTGAIVNRTIDPDLHQPYVQEWGAGLSRQIAGGVTANVDVARRRFVDRPTLVETNARFDGRTFTGYTNEAFNEIYQATNNRWNTPVFTSLELSTTKRTARVQLLASYVRQWRHIDGTWQPHDPASFIQPDAFANDKGIGSSTGTASATTDANSLSGFHMTQPLTASAQWQDHVVRAAAAVNAPWSLLVATNYTFQSGTWSGPIVTRVDAPDPAFGPPTVRLSNGRVVSNPLATVIRFAYPTRGDGQQRTPAVHALNVRAGRRFTFRQLTLDASLDVFNVTNHDADLGFEFMGNQTYNPLFGRTVDRQLPRSAQVVIRAAF